MESPRSILIIRPSALGDVCRSVPVLTSLAKAYPEAQIDWLVQDAFADAIASHPNLRRALPFRRSALGKRWMASSEGRKVFKGLVKSLREPEYDLVIDAQGLGRSGFFAYLTGAPKRIGFANAREMGWLGVNSRIRVEPAITHTVDRMLALVEGAGITPVLDMRLHCNAEDQDTARTLVDCDRCAVVAPTSRWPGKRWPEDRFVAAAEALLGSGTVDRIALVASASETDQCPRLLERCASDERIINLIGKTSVGQLMAVIERASLVLANDSAPLHMAVGFDRPLVALFGPTRIETVGPYRREADVLQAKAPASGVSHKDENAGRAMMEAIETTDVIDACLARLHEQTEAAR